MEVRAVAKGVRISPRKLSLVAKNLRGLGVQEALRRLALIDKRGVVPLEKAIRSALANAVNTAKLPEATLTIKDVSVQQGRALRRYHPSTRGRVHPYKRRSSHITVILEGGTSDGTKS